MLLVRKDAIPIPAQAELARLDPSQLEILGGPSAVSHTVAAELSAHARVTRHAGSDRYSTAASLSAETYPGGTGSIIFIATGEDYPDALAGGAAAGLSGAPILLVRQNDIPETTGAEIERLTGSTCPPPPP